MRLAGARVWVIGASSGIGAALAAELVDRGASVAISARRRDALAEVSAGRMVVEPVDVTSRDSVASAAAAVRDRLGGLDAVVNSSGSWTQMSLRKWEPAAFDTQVETNLKGLMHVIEATLPELRRQRSGTIVGIASVAGFRGMPGSEAYGATKAAAINLLESLRIDLWGTGVDVVTVCPGFVETQLTDVNRFPMPFMMQPPDAAIAICDGLEKGKLEIVFPWQMMVATKLARLVPVRPWAMLLGRRRKASPEA